MENECRKLLGLAPYNTTSNICAHDAYFAQKLYDRYGKDEVKKCLKRLEAQEG